MYAVDVNQAEQSAQISIAYDDLQTLKLVMSDAPEMDQTLLDIPEERIFALADQINGINLKPADSVAILISQQRLSDLFRILNHANDELSKEYEEQAWQQIDNVNQAVSTIMERFVPD